MNLEEQYDDTYGMELFQHRDFGSVGVKRFYDEKKRPAALKFLQPCTGGKPLQSSRCSLRGPVM